MIVTRLKGGLGNQLFQYAAGRALALRRKTDLQLDTSWFETAKDRNYQLEQFRIQASVLAADETRALGRWCGARYRKLTRLMREARMPFGVLILEDWGREFVDEVMTARGNILLDGFWQSERYFTSHERQIREDLTFLFEPDAENRRLLDQIKSCQAVALHVRRGDYVADSGTNAHHGTCDLDYYRRAVEKLLLHVRYPHFFIFSDDPEWSRHHIKIEAPCTYISHNTGRQDFEDMRLMSHCRHFIIANSSFSWWGAWLSENPDKMIISPSRWFANPDMPSGHMIPDRWIRM